MNEGGYVLDASALLAMMLGEDGADHVQARLPDACVSAVNLSEVIAKLQERGVPDADIDESIADLDLTVVAFDAAQADRAGKLRLATRPLGLSLGDRACLALAAERDAVAVTTDAAWERADVGVRVELAR